MFSVSQCHWLGLRLAWLPLSYWRNEKELRMVACMNFTTQLHKLIKTKINNDASDEMELSFFCPHQFSNLKLQHHHRQNEHICIILLVSMTLFMKLHIMKSTE